MDWVTGIQNAINYIEDHITEPIDYEQAAKQSFSTQIPEGIRKRLHEDCVLGAEYADRFEHVRIAPQTYVIFETERTEFPTMHHMELR